MCMSLYLRQKVVEDLLATLLSSHTLEGRGGYERVVVAVLGWGRGLQGR